MRRQLCNLDELAIGRTPGHLHPLSQKRLLVQAVELVTVPMAFVNFIGTAVWVALWPNGNRPIWYLVPDGVVQYVSKRGLYRSHALTEQNR